MFKSPSCLCLMTSRLIRRSRWTTTCLTSELNWLFLFQFVLWFRDSFLWCYIHLILFLIMLSFFLVGRICQVTLNSRSIVLLFSVTWEKGLALMTRTFRYVHTLVMKLATGSLMISLHYPDTPFWVHYGYHQ